MFGQSLGLMVERQLQLINNFIFYFIIIESKGGFSVSALMVFHELSSQKQNIGEAFRTLAS